LLFQKEGNGIIRLEYTELGESIMAFILETVLTGWMDPLLWFKSMSTLYIQKSKTRCRYSFFVYYILIIVKQFISNYINNNTICAIVMIGVEIYVICATMFLFEGRLREKAISVFIFYCILSATELIVIEWCVTFVRLDFDAILHSRIVNFTCGFLIKLLQVILCYCFFGSMKIKQFFYRNKERVTLTVIVSIMLVCFLSKGIMQEKNSDTLLLLEIVWLLFLWNVFSFLITLKKKDKCILDLQQDANNNVKRNELAQDIERFKYNFPVNVLIMKNLFCYKQYDRFEKYMEEVFQDVEKAELLFNHSNITIRILISGLIQSAKEMRIPLSVRIQVREFGMDDEEICSILQNLVKNGLEAAAKVPHEIAHVSLQVLYNEVGYEIRCINDCMGTVDFTKTSKLNKRMHGFGVGIVDKIVKKHHGIVKREYVETEKSGIGLVIVSILIVL